MNIALDYDGTYTLDPRFWDGVILAAMANSHSVCVVTARMESMKYAEVRPPCVVWCTGGEKKRAWCERNGVVVDVWIDDRPESV